MDGFPNSRTSILHQKLQMINVCIDRKKRRDEAALLGISSNDNASESEEEFFDCGDDDEENSTAKKKYLPWNRPEGRLGKFGHLLLLGSGEPMYIPITQEPVPKTEDQLEQDAEVMLNLGADSKGSELRATIMSASLLSDMESFKAANPDCLFEDFIRWYSPKDWIEGDELDEHGQKKGHLSTRMQIPDNIWVEFWKLAKMVPAKRQRRLFDDTTEAEKTLHFLETRNISQIVGLLIPSLTHAVLCRLGEECVDKVELPKLGTSFERLVSIATKLTRDKVEVKKYKNLAEQMYIAELLVAQCSSLRLKFEGEKESGGREEMVKFLGELLKGEEAEVPGASNGRLGKIICRMFHDAQMTGKSGRETPDYSSSSASLDNPFPVPVVKEFVLRVMARRPASTSTPSPQMMRAILKKDEFRILGAFSEDLIFA